MIDILAVGYWLLAIGILANFEVEVPYFPIPYFPIRYSLFDVRHFPGELQTKTIQR